MRASVMAEGPLQMLALATHRAARLVLRAPRDVGARRGMDVWVNDAMVMDTRRTRG